MLLLFYEILFNMCIFVEKTYLCVKTQHPFFSSLLQPELSSGNGLLPGKLRWLPISYWVFPQFLVSKTGKDKSTYSRMHAALRQIEIIMIYCGFIHHKQISSKDEVTAKTTSSHPSLSFLLDHFVQAVRNYLAKWRLIQFQCLLRTIPSWKLIRLFRIPSRFFGATRFRNTPCNRLIGTSSYSSHEP